MAKKRKPDWEHLTKEDEVKLEIAKEIGLFEKIKEGGYRSLSAKESGKIGGILASRRATEEKEIRNKKVTKE